MRHGKVLAVLIIILATTTWSLTAAALLSRSAQSVQAGEKQAKTLLERVEALEKENARLRRHIESKFQRGGYRMSEMQADHRELEARVDKHEDRLDLGKKRMREIEERITENLDRIWKHHPPKKEKR